GGEAAVAAQEGGVEAVGGRRGEASVEGLGDGAAQGRAAAAERPLQGAPGEGGVALLVGGDPAQGGGEGRVVTCPRGHVELGGGEGLADAADADEGDDEADEVGGAVEGAAEGEGARADGGAGVVRGEGEGVAGVA